MGHKHAINIFEEPRAVGGLAFKAMIASAVIGLVGLGAGWVLGSDSTTHHARFAYSYLFAFVTVLSISLGALIYLLVTTMFRAGFGVVVRRVPENLAAVFPVLFLLYLPILYFRHQIFGWYHADEAYKAAIAGNKFNYLSENWFIIRSVAYFVVWSVLGLLFRHLSIKQDSTGDPRNTRILEMVAAPGTFLFAASSTFFAFDNIMSLDYHWFSTMFGVYYFAGSMTAGVAVTILLCMLYQANGILPRAITTEHFHDLGKLLFAMICFWAYIAFSQFMLIWYANIPEETLWYKHRMEHGWEKVGLLLIFGHFIIPFVGFMSRINKRSRMLLGFWAVWMLLMHAADMYYLVMPNFGMHGEVHGGGAGAAGHGLEIVASDPALVVGLAGILFAAFFFLAGRASAVPVRDPRLHESLTLENF